MSRPLGYHNKNPTKPHRDRKYKRYRKTKGGFLIPYISKRYDKSAPVRIQFVMVEPMSIDGYRNFSHKARAKIRRVIYKAIGHTAFVEPSEISTPEKIGQTAINIVGFDGTFQMRMFGHARNTHHVSPYKRATIKITETESGFKAFVSEYSNMGRYWFWRGK